MPSSQPLYRLNVKKPSILSLIFLSSFATMGVIMIAPALPAISLDYNVSKTTVQFGMTLFLLGYAIGQLIFGPVANRYGRKPALYAGLLIACLGSVLTIAANNIHYHPLFVAGRFIEALGSSCGLVLSFAIVNDFYFLEEARKLSALLILAFAIMPSIAIALGGAITSYLGWKFCFYFLLAYGITLFYFVAKLPETLAAADPQALNYKRFFSRYLATIKNRNLVTYALIYGLSTGCAYSFSTEGPFIGIHVLHLDPLVYGALGTLPFAGMILGSLFAAHAAKFIKASIMGKIGFFSELLGTIMLLLFFTAHEINIWTLIAPLIVFFFGHAIVASNFSALGISQTDDKAHGSGMVNFLNLSAAVTITLILSMLSFLGTILLPVIYSSALVVMVLISWINFILLKDKKV